MILFGRHKSEIRRETDFFAKGKRLIANEIGGDDECIQAGYFKMGGGSRVRLFIVQQIVHRDAQQTADGQEFVGVGQGLAGFPKLKILVMYECLRLLA